MRLSVKRSMGREAFTLIEILMVTAIIGVLVGLLIAGISFVTTRAPEMQVRNDINQLGIALESFKSQYSFYPPSQFILCENNNDYSNPALMGSFHPLLVQDSREYLGKMFNRLANNAAWMGPSPGSGGPATNFLDWNQDGSYTRPVVLTGDQCLVFFLGGIQTRVGVNAVNGFTSSPSGGTPATPSNPFPTGAANGPYFEFRSDRLVAQTNGYFSYADAYRSPTPSGGLAVYAYFSSGKTRNNYNRYVNAVFKASDCSTLPSWTPGASALGTGVYPYQQAAGNFHNPNSYQIIAPGKDGIFGVGSPVAAAQANMSGYFWVSDSESQYGPRGVPNNTSGLGDGRDDATNFNFSVLGKQ